MIVERNRYKFYELYNKQHYTLHRRHCCQQNVRIEYEPGYGVRLSCPCGEGVLILKRKDLPKIKTEEEFVAYAVEEWNAGRTNW